jgi:hypothetical protein
MVIRPRRCRHLGNLCQGRDQFAPDALVLINRANVQGGEARIFSSSPHRPCFLTLSFRALTHQFSPYLLVSCPDRTLPGDGSRPIAVITGRVSRGVQSRITWKLRGAKPACRRSVPLERRVSHHSPVIATFHDKRLSLLLLQSHLSTPATIPSPSPRSAANAERGGPKRSRTGRRLWPSMQRTS